MKRKPIIAGNWKMNPGTRDEARAIFLATRRAIETHENVTAIVCPPFVYVRELATLTKGRRRLFVGAQNCFFETHGAYTGEVSAGQLADVGASHVIIGHSERRAMGETDEIVNKKIKSALREGLVSIVCIGEKERDSDGHYLSLIRSSLEVSLSGVSGADLSKIIIAYEPVWAIGKSEREAMKPHDLHEMAIFIRKTLSKPYGTPLAFKMPILYGGSVGPSTVAEHLGAGVEGLLVGRASADVKSVAEVIEAAASAK